MSIKSFVLPALAGLSLLALIGCGTTPSGLSSSTPSAYLPPVKPSVLGGRLGPRTGQEKTLLVRPSPVYTFRGHPLPYLPSSE